MEVWSVSMVTRGEPEELGALPEGERPESRRDAEETSAS